MKVLVLSITAGQGHHQCAMALIDYLKSKNVECEMVDALKHITPMLSESVAQGYLLSTQYSPSAYGSFYRLAEKKGKPSAKVSLSRIAANILSMKMSKYIKKSKPDLVVCTHVYSAQMVTEMSHIEAKTIGIITDFTIHPFWEDTDLDYYITASELLTHQAMKKGIPKEKVKPFGIPIQEKFQTILDKKEARKRLGFEDKTTVFVMSGSMGYGNLVKHIRRLDKLSLDFQIVSVCGRNKRMKRTIDALVTTKKIHNYGYVDNIDLIMDASDVIITKPGGLTVSEALAKGLSMILMNPIPGQEDRNAEFLLNNGIAMMMSSTCTVDEYLYQMLNNKWRLENLQEGVRYMGKPNAAKDLGDFIIETLDS